MRVSILMCAALACAAQLAFAQTYPTKALRLISPYPPGGGTDATARAIAPKMSELLGQQVIIDNRPGATGNIATDITAKSNPDGYTILMGTIAALAINPSLYEKLPFDPLKDLLPVTRAVDSTNVLVVHPSVAAKTVKELIGLAKAKPGALNCGSSGVGGAGHLALELFNLQTATKITHIPYKGGGPAMTDLMGGQIQLIFATAASAVGPIKSGKIRALAVTTLKRTALLPNLPTVDELGLKGFDATTWHGLVAPAGTPKDIIETLNIATTEALKDPATQKALLDLGVDVIGSSPKEFEDYIKSEIPKWTAVVKASGAQID